MWTMNIKKENGLYYCFRCGEHGNWNRFVQLLIGSEITDTSGDKPKILKLTPEQ